VQYGKLLSRSGRPLAESKNALCSLLELYLGEDVKFSSLSEKTNACTDQVIQNYVLNGHYEANESKFVQALSLFEEETFGNFEDADGVSFALNSRSVSASSLPDNLANRTHLRKVDYPAWSSFVLFLCNHDSSIVCPATSSED
jgi:hypothetical protein